MAEYGFLFEGTNGLSVVAGDFSNYSLLNEFSVGVSTGRTRINLGATISRPLILVRHRGFGVGFLNYNGDPTTSVDIYVQGSGTLEVRVFSPDQVRGLTGHGLWIGDFSGREVYHSDLKYLNVTGRVGVNGGAGQFYVLGTRRQLRFDYRRVIDQRDWTTPIYGWVNECNWETVCGWVTEQQYNSQTMRWENVQVYRCRLERVCRDVWTITGYYYYGWVTYEIFLRKRILVIYQASNGSFSEGRIQLSDERVFQEVYNWDTTADTNWAWSTEQRIFNNTVGFVDNQYVLNPPPGAVSSLGTRLIVSDMQYA